MYEKIAQGETRLVNEKLRIMPEHERKEIDKLINYALIWWLTVIYDNNYSKQKFETKTNELDSFKLIFGLGVLRQMIAKNDVELSCQEQPIGLLPAILQVSNCEYLKQYIPTDIKMSIENGKILVITKLHNKENKLQIFDINSSDEFEQVKAVIKSFLGLNDLGLYIASDEYITKMNEKSELTSEEYSEYLKSLKNVENALNKIKNCRDTEKVAFVQPLNFSFTDLHLRYTDDDFNFEEKII